MICVLQIFWLSQQFRPLKMTASHCPKMLGTLWHRSYKNGNLICTMHSSISQHCILYHHVHNNPFHIFLCLAYVIMLTEHRSDNSTKHKRQCRVYIHVMVLEKYLLSWQFRVCVSAFQWTRTLLPRSLKVQTPASKQISHCPKILLDIRWRLPSSTHLCFVSGTAFSPVGC